MHACTIVIIIACTVIDVSLRKKYIRFTWVQ